MGGDTYPPTLQYGVLINNIDEIKNLYLANESVNKNFLDESEKTILEMSFINYLKNLESLPLVYKEFTNSGFKLQLSDQKSEYLCCGGIVPEAYSRWEDIGPNIKSYNFIFGFELKIKTLNSPDFNFSEWKAERKRILSNLIKFMNKNNITTGKIKFWMGCFA